MHFHITARHLDLTPAISEHVEKKLERVARHFNAMIRAQVVLSVEKHRHMAEVVVHANGHHDFRAKEVAGDLYAAVDLVAEKLHKHMARQKDKRVRGRRRGKPEFAEVPVPVIAAPEDGAAPEPRITRVSRFTPESMTAAEAAEEMERHGYDFLVFMNDDVLSVLYRRKDKTYGLLEPNL